MWKCERVNIYEAREFGAMKFIFRVHIQPGHTAEEYAKAWVEASEIIQRAAGARGTRLHRRIGKDDELLAIASWESKAHRDAAPQDPKVREILETAARYVRIELIGEFDAPEWVVLPPNADSDAQ